MTQTRARPAGVAVPVPAAPRARGRGFRRLIVTILALCVAGMLVAAGAVVSQARQYDTTRTDAIVVLGASQYWGEPSPVFANRLEHAARLYHDGVADTVVTVGGGIPGDKTTEANAGAAYLTGLGVPAESIVVVPRGSDTVGSLRAIARTKVAQEWDSLTLVSDRAHLARSGAVADTLGFDVHVNGPASGDGALLTPEYIAKESAGLIRFAVYDRWLIMGGV